MFASCSVDELHGLSKDDERRKAEFVGDDVFNSALNPHP